MKVFVLLLLSARTPPASSPHACAPSRPAAGELVVEANTEEVRQATVSPKYGSLALAAPPPGSTAAVPLVAGAAGRCIRSPHCTKAAGHPGFCSGPKAAAAAAAKQHRAAAHHASHGHTHAHHHHAAAATSDASARGAAAGSGSSGEEAATRLGTPRSGRSAGVAAAEWAAAAAAAAAKLPEGLHEVAHVPTGLRLAKVLTGYDLSSRRVVMPVPAVEAGFATAPSVDLLTLAAVDESEVRRRSRALRASSLETGLATLLACAPLGSPALPAATVN